jgi:hypothetical protein
MKKAFYSALVAAVLALSPIKGAWAYIYVHNEAEYSIELPDAPHGTTIWADQEEPVPYLEKPPKYGMLGEHATMRRANVDTGDIFDVDITFLKADRDFLLSLTKEKLMETLKDLYKETPLDNPEEHYSQGTDTLKWATLTGFTVDSTNSLHYNAAHYLVGLETIMVIKVNYTVENEQFQKWYDVLAKSIKYVGK